MFERADFGKFQAPGIGQGSTVTVVDGESTDDEADRVEFCGYKPPPDFVSSTRNLHIMLKQELQPHGKGTSLLITSFFIELEQVFFNLKWHLKFETTFNLFLRCQNNVRIRGDKTTTVECQTQQSPAINTSDWSARWRIICWRIITRTRATWARGTELTLNRDLFEPDFCSLDINIETNWNHQTLTCLY